MCPFLVARWPGRDNRSRTFLAVPTEIPACRDISRSEAVGLLLMISTATSLPSDTVSLCTLPSRPHPAVQPGTFPT